MSHDPAPIELKADCSRCEAICCVAPTFSASSDFAIDKAPGTPCPNLGADHRCQIHTRLRAEGFPGCVAFDCFGAGQQLVQHTFRGRSWREDPEVAELIFEAFHGMRAMHAMLWCIEEALAMGVEPSLSERLRQARANTEELVRQPPEGLTGNAMTERWAEVNGLIAEVSAGLRSAVAEPGEDHQGDELIGQDLRAHNLAGANLRGTLLLGVDLRGARLHLTDLAGADLRGARLQGADLSTVLFLSDMQLSSARGDAHTLLPPGRGRPAHWED